MHPPPAPLAPPPPPPGDFARSLVAGGPPCALAVFGRGWEDLVGTRTPPSQPTAA
jgi:hypothetical protein